ncbi:L,D-transpeptidase [Conexibacter woesei]|uniref:ErfK/YbiS/YcfS/YnhG family protein n=1 Tax=Conexibacter woesei (strain DSM 14684 / CCUG 47730 / CIP 108061 / JCM 11494 / NBRC 100937 / ID131577) TaxID=469383 RepID=D3FDU4_CONWI|nr:L,D-transpeptidase [Conexibacter woesei]ADB51560.1 ErfK/YbiS/YcfS/YnhG family protein [Conexibacter woesei DSM 14684]
MLRGVATLVCLPALVAGAAAAQATAAARVAPRQLVAALPTAHDARDRPTADGRLVARVGSRRPITRVRTALPVIGQTSDRRGRGWLRVRLPGRTLALTPPRSGWIRAAHVRLSTTAWHIVVDVGARRVTVYGGGRRLRTFSAIVGKRSTPTPRGAYFVEENVRLPGDAAGAPFALATSARSNVLQEFAGGPGQIALHGLDNVGGQLGTAVSHGCIRLATSAVTWLATRMTPGVPITIA